VIFNPGQRSVGKRGLAPRKMIPIGTQAEFSKNQGAELDFPAGLAQFTESLLFNEVKLG
jgi:hypothetical protein